MLSMNLVQRKEHLLVTAYVHDQRINTKDEVLKNIGGKERGDDVRI